MVPARAAACAIVPASQTLCKDRVYATTMGAMAVDLLCEGKSNRVIGHKGGKFVDFDIDEALAMKKDVDEYMYEISKTLV